MWITRNNKPIVFEKSDTQALLDRAAMAQLHNHHPDSYSTEEMFSRWMRDRQQLTDLIAELARKVKELSS